MARKKLDNSKEALDDQRSLQEFRKSNDAIAIRLSQGRLSLLSRKIFNVLVFHAQTGRGKGVGAPTKSETSDSFFWISLSDLARDARYDSNDMKIFKEQVQELQDFRIVGEDATQWVSERLLASIKLLNPHGLGSRKGQVTIGYAFPPEVERMVMEPNSYTKISIYYQGLLRRAASLALYEICRRYATNPSKVTMRKTPDWWFHVLTGSAITEEAPDYRYFKRDTIKPAISEINAITDIEVELIEHTQGRKVIELQFSVIQKKQTPLFLEPVIDSALMSRIMALDITQDDALNIMAMTEDAKLRATLDLVEARLKNKKAQPVDSPAGYFKKALQDNYAAPQEVAKKTIAAKPAEPDPDSSIRLIREKYLASRAKEALALFKEMDSDEQEDLIEQFKASDNAKGLKITKALSTTPVRSAFSHWYAHKLWQEPTDLDLLRFAASSMK